MKIKAPKNLFLLELLSLLSPDSSKNTLRGWIEQGRVSVDGRILKRADAPIQEGQSLEVSKRFTFAGDLKILYEDDHLVVLEKPEGLLSVATDFDKERNVHTLLKRRHDKQRVFPVHRLDRETSGVMLFAYSEMAKDHLKKQFYHHSIEREYHAIVEGRLEPIRGTWKSHLIEDEAYYVSSHPSEGQLAITHYEVLSYSRTLTFLKLTLETGRKNQIRVHCKEAGHPIFGDQKYVAKLSHAPRLCLHASRIQFIHPYLNKPFTFTSAIPDCFLNLMPKRIPGIK